MMPKIPLVYVAGRFRGATAWDIEKNVRAAEEMALTVAKAGAMPLCPHANTRFFHGQLTDEFWLLGTLEMLSRCDAVVLVPGWEASIGTKAEIAFAERHGIPVLYTWLGEDLRGFIEQEKERTR